MPILLGLALAGLGILAGAVLGTQVAINAMVSRAFGTPIVAAGISFGAGALLLLVISLAMTRLQGVSSGWRDLPLWTFVAGGLLGVIYLTSAIFLAPRIGAAATMGFVISGQLLAGLVLDVFGLFGLPQIAMSLPRFVGAALLLGGALIMRFA